MSFATCILNDRLYDSELKKARIWSFGLIDEIPSLPREAIQSSREDQWELAQAAYSLDLCGWGIRKELMKMSRKLIA